MISYTVVTDTQLEIQTYRGLCKNQGLVSIS